MAEANFKVEGMSCEHCKTQVLGSLLSTEGVEEAEVDLETGRTRVIYQPDLVKPEDLVKAVTDLGYKAKEA